MRRWRSYYFLAVPILALVLFSQYPHLNETAHAIFDTFARPALVVGSGFRQVFYSLRYQSGNYLDAVGKQKQYLERIGA